MWIKYVLLCIVATSGGVTIAASYVAFISLVGIFPRLAEENKSAKHMYIIEWLIILGVISGNLASIYLFKLPGGQVGLSIVALFGGVFTGCLAGALAEVLDIFPILSRRLKIREYLPYIIFAVALGKAVGNYFQFYLNK